jgi:pyruvate dehydrogenase E2 component (dihydrolipoamide acetyltransferase)
MLAEIETDKATMEFEAAEEGRIARLVVPEGTPDVAVGTVIALIAEEGEAAPGARSAEPVVAQAVLEAPAQASVEAAPAMPAVRTEVEPVVPTVLDAAANATPLARRIAAIRKIALGSVTGTGPGGKITKADLGIPSIIRPSAGAAPAPAAPEPVIAPPPEGVPVETVRLSSMRKTIARRLAESKASVPHFYLTARCNLDPLLALRAQLNRSLEGQGIKLSVNDMLMKALAVALTRVPDANVQFGGAVLHKFARVDVAMAVAIDGGLVTPVIRDVGAKSLSAIARESKALAEKARAGGLTPMDYAGGTVSLSNLGMFGIDEMVPIINPPQAMILGVGAGIRQPWDVDGEMALATVMAATASFDHRAIDGAVAAQAMAAFRNAVEDPLGMVA